MDNKITVADLSSAFSANFKGFIFGKAYEASYDLPLIWEEGVICYIESEDTLYISAGPAVWHVFDPTSIAALTPIKKAKESINNRKI
jgi:hypothetical protein